MKEYSLTRDQKNCQIYQITIYQPSSSSSQILSSFRKIVDSRVSPLSSRKYTSREIRISTFRVDRLLLSAKDWPAMGHRLVVSWPQEKSLCSARLTRRMILDGMSKIAGWCIRVVYFSRHILSPNIGATVGWYRGDERAAWENEIVRYKSIIRIGNWDSGQKCQITGNRLISIKKSRDVEYLIA